LLVINKRITYLLSCVVEWFQALIGDRYGKLFLQERIPTSVFKLFLDIAKDMKVLHSHLLDELYELDENAVPPVYALKVCSNSRGRLEFFNCCFFHTLHLVLHFSVAHLSAPSGQSWLFQQLFRCRHLLLPGTRTSMK